MSRLDPHPNDGLDSVISLLDDLVSGNICSTSEENEDACILGDEQSSDKDLSDTDDELGIKEVEDSLECNKRLLTTWKWLKKYVTSLLKKIQYNLDEINSKIGDLSQADKYVALYNPGIPYFKDKGYFLPPPNPDEASIKAKGELQVEMLPKVSPWSAAQRSSLVKAVRDQIMTETLEKLAMEAKSKDNDSEEEDSDCDTRRKKQTKDKKNKKFIPENFKVMVGPLGTREFKWSEIVSSTVSNFHNPLECKVMWNVFLHPAISKAKWKKPEDLMLKNLVRRYKYQNWDKIAKGLGTNRSAYQCFIRYHTTKKMPRIKNSVWLPEEDKRLRKLIEILQIGNYIPWGEVANWMKNRSRHQVYYRWTYSLSPELTKGRFTENEKNTLKEAITRYGEDFTKISVNLMPNRSAAQLSDHYQRSVTVVNEWTAEEDYKLILLHERMGPKWAEISQYFENRSRTQLRHHHRSLRKVINKGFSALCMPHELGGVEIQSTAEVSEQLDEEFLDDLDIELIEHFRPNVDPQPSITKQDSYTDAELEEHTEHLYDVLKLMDTKLDIPNNLNDYCFTLKQMQLLLSLKNYNSVSDKEVTTKNVAEEQTTSVQDSSVQSTSSSQSIDTILNMKETHLLRMPEEIKTLEIAQSYISENEDYAFSKIAKVMQTRNLQNGTDATIQELAVPNPALSKSKDEAANSCESVSLNKSTSNNPVNRQKNSLQIPKNIGSNLFMFPTILKEELPPIPVESDVTDTTLRVFEPSAIEPTYESLLGLKNLAYLGKLLARMQKSSKAQVEKEKMEVTEVTNEEHKQALALLKKRMLLLFKYPLGLAKTELPEFHDADLFLPEENSLKRKRRTRKKPDKKAKLSEDKET